MPIKSLININIRVITFITLRSIFLNEYRWYRILQNQVFRTRHRVTWLIFGISGFLALFFLVFTTCYWAFPCNAFIYHQLYLAFNSVEHIMRDVSIWLVIIDIYTHNGASFFFIVVYLHYVSCLYYDHILYMIALFIMGCWCNYFFSNDLLLLF